VLAQKFLVIGILDLMEPAIASIIHWNVKAPGCEVLGV